MNYVLAFGLAGICHLTHPQHSASLSTTPFWPSLSLSKALSKSSHEQPSRYTPLSRGGCSRFLRPRNRCHWQMSAMFRAIVPDNRTRYPNSPFDGPIALDSQPHSAQSAFFFKGLLGQSNQVCATQQDHACVQMNAIAVRSNTRLSKGILARNRILWPESHPASCPDG